MRLDRTLALAALLPLTFACGSEEPAEIPRFEMAWGWKPAPGSTPAALVQNPDNGYLFVGLDPVEGAEETPVGPGFVLTHAGDEVGPLTWYEGCPNCEMRSPGRGFFVGETLLLGPDVGVSGLYGIDLSRNVALPVELANPRNYKVEFSGFDARTGAVRPEVDRILLPGAAITEIGDDGIISDAYDAPAPVRQLLRLGESDYLAILTGTDGNDLLGRWSPTAPRLESWATATVEGKLVQLDTANGWTVAVVEREEGLRTLATVDLDTLSLEPLGGLVIDGEAQIAVRAMKQQVVVAVGMVAGVLEDGPATGDLILLDAAGNELARQHTPAVVVDDVEIPVEPVDTIIGPDDKVYVAHELGVTAFKLP